MYNANAQHIVRLHIRQHTLDEQTITKNKVLTCLECKNDTQLPDDLKVGDVVECEFCGIEYEVKAVGEEYTLALIEDEK